VNRLDAIVAVTASPLIATMHFWLPLAVGFVSDAWFWLVKIAIAH
jgi:hypothetical protein